MGAWGWGWGWKRGLWGASLGGVAARRLQSAGVDAHVPEGAFYLFPDFCSHREKLRERGIGSSVEFCSRLLEETGVALLPGTGFGRPPTEFTARLAYVDFAGSHCLTMAEAMPADRELDEHFLMLHCANVLDAVDLISDWLK